MTQDDNSQAIATSAHKGNGLRTKEPVFLSAGDDFVDGAFSTHNAPTSISQYLHALRRRWFLAFSIGLLCAAVSGGITWYLRPASQYTASAYLRVASSEENPLFPDQNNQSEYNIYKRTQMQLLKNRFVLTRALGDESISQLPFLQRIQKEEGVEDPITWLQNELKVSYPDESEIMEIKLTSEDRNAVVPIVNAIIKYYLEEVVQKERQDKFKQAEEVRKIYLEMQTELRTKWTQLRKLAEDLGGGDKESISVAQQNKIKQLGTYQSELIRSEIDLLRVLVELEQQNQEANDEKGEESPDNKKADPESELIAFRLEQVLDSDRKILEMKSQLDGIETQIELIQNTLQEQKAAPLIKEQEEKRLEIESKIAERKETIQKEFHHEKSLLEKVESESEEKTLNEREAFLKKHVAAISEKVKELEAETNQSSGESIDIDFMRREIEPLEDILNDIGKEIEQNNVELRISPLSPRITTLSKADYAREVKSTSAYTLTGLAGFAGLFLPIIGIVWLDTRKRRLNTTSEISQSLQLNVLGSVPFIPARHLKRIQHPSRHRRHWSRIINESSDAIAATILHRAEIAKEQILMITSPSAGEGKTTLSKQLATSLATTGSRTLLVDFDLRRPALHNMFNIDLSPGIRELLDDQTNLISATHETGTTNLWVMPAGSAEFKGMDRNSQENISKLFNLLRDQFDFIIIDSSPILSAVETRLVGKQVDGVIISVLRDVSQRPQLQAACNILESFNIPLIGTVMTGSEPEMYYSAHY